MLTMFTEEEDFFIIYVRYSSYLVIQNLEKIFRKFRTK